MFDAVVDFLYPPCCLLCHLPRGGRTAEICPACRASIRGLDGSHDAWREAEQKLCGDGLLDGFHALYLFERKGALQTALHLLKYGGLHSLGVLFGRDLGGALSATEHLPAFDVAVPVPLHPAKLRERGYNQSERICAGIHSVTGVPVGGRMLRRTRHTRSQTALNVRERERNVRGAFRLARGEARAVRDASILLVDDVVTTGATLRSCAGALKDAGAGAVWCAAVAIAGIDT